MATYGFSEKGAKRIVSATKRVERMGPVQERAGVNPPRGDARRKVCTLVSEDDDTLTVTLPGGTSPTDDVVVAKPFLLRRTPFEGTGRNGFTYVYSSANERTSTKVSDSSTEEQKITPDYVTDDEIIIRRINGAELFGLDLEDIKWIDVNNDSRSWAMVAE